MKKMLNVAVIGGGPAGCAFSCFCQKAKITVFEKNEPLKTLLYTGGGRCNLAHAEFDIKDLARNYPRGEKFLYSVFYRFSTSDTLKFFKSLGIDTYVQNDKRIFPKTDKASDVRDAMLEKLKKGHVDFIRENVVKLEKCADVFLLNDKYEFDKVVIATGGHAGYSLAQNLGHNIIEPKPSLVGLITLEKFNLEGVSLRNTCMRVKNLKKTLVGDLIFTKNGISGPLAYIVSSLFARATYDESNPIELTIDFGCINLVEMLDKNGKKDVKNCISEIVPKSVAEYIVNHAEVEGKKCFEITKDKRKILEKFLNEFPVTVVGHEKHGEVVTCGGVDLKEINPKTMESRIVDGLYFCGEVADIDGFCGGFNLQNAWSTAYVAADGVLCSRCGL